MTTGVVSYLVTKLVRSTAPDIHFCSVQSPFGEPPTVRGEGAVRPFNPIAHRIPERLCHASWRGRTPGDGTVHQQICSCHVSSQRLAEVESLCPAFIHKGPQQVQGTEKGTQLSPCAQGPSVQEGTWVRCTHCSRHCMWQDCRQRRGGGPSFGLGESRKVHKLS